MKIIGSIQSVRKDRGYSIFMAGYSLSVVLSVLLLVALMLGSTDRIRIENIEIVAYALAGTLAMQAMCHLAARNRRISFEEAEKRLLGNQIEAQAQSLKRLQDGREDDRRLRHDLRQHIRTISELANQGKSEELQDYVKTLDSFTSQTSSIRLTANVQLDALVRYYQAYAIDKSVAFEASLRLPEDLGVDAVQLNTVLGNLLENAVDAARGDESTEAQPDAFVRISAAVKNSTLVFAIDNSYAGNVQEVDGNFASTKHAGPGIGISSSRNMVQKLGGIISFAHGAGVFKTRVSIPADLDTGHSPQIQESPDCSGLSKSAL